MGQSHGGLKEMQPTLSIHGRHLNIALIYRMHEWIYKTTIAPASNPAGPMIFTPTE